MIWCSPQSQNSTACRSSFFAPGRAYLSLLLLQAAKVIFCFYRSAQTPNNQFFSYQLSMVHLIHSTAACRMLPATSIQVIWCSTFFNNRSQCIPQRWKCGQSVTTAAMMKRLLSSLLGALKGFRNDFGPGEKSLTTEAVGGAKIWFHNEEKN